tara:strand:- start:180 stop:470 length:291 start_codon:yes stop_codon:yes gene_type:complete
MYYIRYTKGNKMEEIKIRLKISTAERLKGIKIIDRESYDSVINRLLEDKDYEENLNLSDELKKNLNRGVEDVKKGRIYTSEEARERLRKIRGKNGK